MGNLNLTTTPLLTSADEIALARRMEAGVYAEHLLATSWPSWATPDLLTWAVDDGVIAWQNFYAANLRLAALVAFRASRRYHVDTDDIIQECCLELGRSIRAWDYTAGSRFSTFAWSRLNYIAQQSCLGLRNGGLIPRNIRHAPCQLPAEMDTPADEVCVDLLDVVWICLPCLDPVARGVVESRFGLRTGKPRSYALVAQDLATTPYAIRRIEKKALMQLESHVTRWV